MEGGLKMSEYRRPECFEEMKTGQNEHAGCVYCPLCTVTFPRWYSRDQIEYYWKGFERAKDEIRPKLIIKIREFMTIGDQYGLCSPERERVEEQVESILSECGPKQ